jgi:hypothetical protein
MNISSYGWVNGTIFQDCFSRHSVPDVGQQCSRNNLSFKTILVWTMLLNPQIIKGLLSSNLSCLYAFQYDKQNTSYGSVCHSYLPAVPYARPKR